MAVALALPAAAGAQSPWGGRPAPVQSQAGYREGFAQGERAGFEDARRNDPFRFTDEDDYRRGDVGYRPTFGSREAYRNDFRYGFEAGYRQGYDRIRQGNGNGRYGSWSGGRAVPRFDLASDTGFNDGYRAGLDDGRNNRRADARLERDYRDGDNGYERWYGPKEVYAQNYRQGFIDGYQRGYQDSVRYR